MYKDGELRSCIYQDLISSGLSPEEAWEQIEQMSFADDED